MLCIKFDNLLKYAGIVGSGMIVGALFTGVAIQLPMLIEAEWRKDAKQIKFDSRAFCEVKEIGLEEIDEGEAISQ